MSNPAAPHIPDDAEHRDPNAPPGQSPDDDGTDGFDPDAARLRPEDEARGRDTTSASTSGSVRLGDDDFAPEAPVR